MAFEMDLLDGFELKDTTRKWSTMPGQKSKKFQNRLNMANASGTGFLQEKLPFEDIESIIDPQKRLSLLQSTDDFNDRREQLFKAFDTIRSRRGVTRSGFIDYAEQNSLTALGRERQKALYDNEQRITQLSSSLRSRNDDVITRNRQKLFDVFGDDIYDSLKSLRENR
jgi:hypothetical protein